MYRIGFKLEDILQIANYSLPIWKNTKEMTSNHDVARVVKDGEDCTIANDKLEEFGLIFYNLGKP